MDRQLLLVLGILAAAWFVFPTLNELTKALIPNTRLADFAAVAIAATITYFVVKRYNRG